MHWRSQARCLLALTSGWFLALACGSRTGLPPGRVLATAGSAPMAGMPNVPECAVAAECPQPPPGQCGEAQCLDGVCVLNLRQACDDGDPCTVDSCENNTCVFVDGHVDADGDGVPARGTSADPNAALGCGKDCNDLDPNVFPGAVELCDSIDNDCNGIVDDGTKLRLTQDQPVRVSPLESSDSSGSGLAFNGETFGAVMNVRVGETDKLAGQKQAHFRELDIKGNPLGDTQRIAFVNAESYGGPLVWTGQRYLTAYEDARQDNNYEIYFDLLNRQGERLIEDLRITNASDFSLSPSLLWTGAEGLVVWDDRRFEDEGGNSSIFGQRVSSDGQLLGANERLSPPDQWAEGASAALSDDGVGIAFVTLERPSGETRVRFMTTTRALEQPSEPLIIDFSNADAPTVTLVGGKYVVTFHQADAVIGAAIFGVVIGEAGVEFGPQSMTVGRHTRSHATYSLGDRFVMVWADDKESASDGLFRLYAQVFSPRLAPLSDVFKIASTGTSALGPNLAPSSDGGMGILYTDTVAGTCMGKPCSQAQAFFTRLECVERFEQ